MTPRMCSDLTVDRISNLPKNAIEAILMHLPIKDAVRTSILSRNWRYEWNTLPKLVFNEKCVPRPLGSAQKVHDGKRVEIVDQVLLLHRGPILKFRLSFKLERCGDIDRWVLFVSRNGIKEFILDKWEGEFYKVPSCLYLCEEITYLELYRCTIALPASFKGFRNLTALDLNCVNFSNDGLEILISGCPLLKKLVLKYIDGCDHLNICAMKLVDLEIIGEFEDLCFENAPLLSILSINLDFGGDQVVSDGSICKLIQIFGSLPRIERLELSDQTLSILTQGDVPIKLPTACQLKYMLIDLNFEDMQEMLAALCIFRSSPILQKLRIKAFSNKKTALISVEDFWEAQEDFNCLFSRLQIVEVTNFTGTASELKFVEFVLVNAPVLVKVQIELKAKVDGALNILTEMIRFRRVSSKAEIVFRA